MIGRPMRYLRMLTNAVAGGMLVSTYLAILVLQLNPRMPLVSATALRWIGAVMVFYAPYLSVGLFLLLVVREIMAGRPLRPGWLSIRVLAWIGTFGAAGAAAITWANLGIIRGMLTDAAATRMRDGAWATTACAGVLFVVALARYSFGRRGTRTTAAVLTVVMLISVGGPLWLRGPGETPVRPPRRWLPPAPITLAPRVRLLLFDGASLGFIRQRVAAGQLSNLARMLDHGAVMDLATIRPTQVDPVWVAAATGKRAEQNGVRSNGVFRISDADVDVIDELPDYCLAQALVDQGFIRAASNSSASLQARPLWDILADYGLTAGVVNWPLTYPAHASLGYVLSDRFDEAASSPLRLADARSGDPTTAVDVAREIFDAWQARPWHEVLTTFSRGEVEPIEVDRARWDRAYSETAESLEQQFALRFSAIRYEGLEAFGHIYLRQAQPELFGDPRWVAPERPVLDRYYGYLDGEVGQAMRRLAPGDLLIVMSGFGMEPTPLGKRLLARVLGERDLTGQHESGPDGFLLAYGTNVAAGQLPRGSVTDLAPTVLYYLGVPVGRDMDGFARTDLFLSTYAMEHPVKYVASHEK
jgi:Type I phosphodiesterase / nucleotide pyrophosphatase